MLTGASPVNGVSPPQASAPSAQSVDAEEELFAGSYEVLSLEELLPRAGSNPEGNLARPAENMSLEFMPNGEYLTLYGSGGSGQERIEALKVLTAEEY